MKKLHLSGRALAAFALYCFLAGLSVLLQVGNGTYSSDFGAHPDEGAHVVSAIRVRDYIAEGLPAFATPNVFAQRYASQFPEAMGADVPPMFRALAGLWLLAAPTKTAVLLFMAAITALLGTATAIVGRGMGLSWGRAWLAGVVVCMVGAVQRSTSVVLSDSLLAMFALLAAAAFARFYTVRSRGTAFAYGFLTAAAILTAELGWFLVLLPFSMALLLRKIDLLRSREWLISAIPIVVLCGGWALFAGGGNRALAPGRELGEALPLFFIESIRVCGWILFASAVTAIVSIAWNRWVDRDGEEPAGLREVMAAVVIAAGVVCCWMPFELEPRYLVPCCAPCVLLTLDWCRRICDSAALAGQLPRWALASLVGVLVIFETSEVRPKSVSGYESVVQRLSKPVVGDVGTGAYLISSDARGEGAFIAAMALRDRGSLGKFRVIRSSEMLGGPGWLRNGRGNSLGELRQFLSDQKVRAVVVDGGVPEVFRVQHHRVLADALHHQNAAHRIPTQRGNRRSEISIYDPPGHVPQLSLVEW